ncbi:EAL domain-containing protein [Mesotoga sp. UBA5825]|jgi:PAS domain S-box-containing protein|uniref:EAL domain-containing protein n=1 Tax=Mesotoga sp. UBA5825 TaxID=1946858 RepID=UPI000A8D6288|nr:EAL domain-containing protein [Mesotoga sp. UBA5825]
MPVKILVVDDSAADRLMIEKMLSEYDLLTASDGVEAMQRIDEHEEIQLIILDLNMPRMNGFEVLAALKADDRYKRVRTIILTNHEELEDESKGLELGAVDYIRKPISINALKVRVNIHLELLRSRQLAEQKHVELKSVFNTIFSRAPIGISISYASGPKDKNVDPETQINSAFEQITGRTKEELIELGWASITHPDDLEKDLENYRKLKSGEIQSYTMEKRFVRPDGSSVWVEMTVASFHLPGESESGHIALLKDISSRKEFENTLRYSSEHDSWTGLYNRNYLKTLLEGDDENRLREKRALVSVDLSTVQSLTSTYGFQYTQDLIKKIADMLRQFCTDRRLLFNTYENQFAFYLKGYKDKNELTKFSIEVAKQLEPVLLMERIKGGIGVIEIGEGDEKDADLLLRRLLVTSEKAFNIYDRNIGICFYNEEIEKQMVREQQITLELAKISTDEKDFGLFVQFQPILDLKSNKISSFEALARLSIEGLGPVPPLEFIPIAEKTNLVVPIGRKIILQALGFLNKLKRSGYGSIGVSINVSAIQLLRDGFTDSLLEMIEQTQVLPKNVGLEITESVFASNHEKINRILGKLSDIGIHTAIDDFGIGYSSFARERDLNVNCLKIDKSFIDRLQYLESDDAITSDIISMAHKLGHFTIAEGVEHERQKEYLEKWGCDRIQGHLISKPLDEEDAIKFLEKYNRQ